MGNSSEKIEKYFKKTINSTMNNNKNSYIEDKKDLSISATSFKIPLILYLILILSVNASI